MAALSVLVYHVALFTGHAAHTAPGIVIAQLKAGVALFFVISGLVIYRPYARNIRSGEPLPSARYFIRRRVIRIFPAYWVALTLWLLANVLAGHREVVFGHSAGLWTYYGLIQTYSAHTFTAGLSVSWSLCVEFAFYLLLPVLAYGFARLTVAERIRGRWSATNVQLLVLGVLALASFAARLGLTSSWLAPVTTGRVAVAGSLPLLFDWFAIGMALAVVSSEWEERTATLPGLMWLATRPVFCWLIAGYLFLVSALTQGGGELVTLEGACAHAAIGLACATLILPALVQSGTQRPSRVLRVLSSRALTWLGTVSYGIYLLHLPLLLGLRALLLRVPALPGISIPAGLGASTELLLGTLVGAVCLGTASWYLVEQPAQRRWAPKRSRPGTPGDPELHCGRAAFHTQHEAA